MKRMINMFKRVGVWYVKQVENGKMYNANGYFPL